MEEKFVNVKVVNTAELVPDTNSSSTTSIRVFGTISYGSTTKGLNLFEGSFDPKDKNLLVALKDYIVAFVVGNIDLDMQSSQLNESGTFRVYVQSFSIPDLAPANDGSIFVLTGTFRKNSTFGRWDITLTQNAVMYHVS